MGTNRPPDWGGPDFNGDDDVCEVEGRTLRFVHGDILERRAYERAGVATAHAVILGSLQVHFWGATYVNRGAGRGSRTTMLCSVLPI